MTHNATWLVCMIFRHLWMKYRHCELHVHYNQHFFNKTEQWARCAVAVHWMKQNTPLSAQITMQIRGSLNSDPEKYLLRHAWWKTPQHTVSAVMNTHSLFILMYILYSSGIKPHHWMCNVGALRLLYIHTVIPAWGGRGCTSVLKNVKASV